MQHSSLKSKAQRLVRRTIILSVAWALSACSFVDQFIADNSDEIRERNLLTLLAVAYASNPCNRTASPGLSAGAATSGSLINVGSIRGRVTTSAGLPVVNALVLVEDGNQTDSTFYASHSSLGRDGSFEIAGIPVGASYRVSVEPLNLAYAGRIDSHIDCFLSPVAFTYGWYAGSGTTAASTYGSAAVVATTANVRNDIGTLVIRP